jgi:hypothetical protein
MARLYYPACKKMLVDIVYHASTDWRDIQKGATWSDDDHRAICNRYGFTNGEEELREFFASDWFRRMCEEFDDLSDKKILRGLGIIEE